MNFITNLILRPNRNTYSLRELGDKVFTYGNMKFKRIDFNHHIKNKRNEMLSSSLWCPLEMDSMALSQSPCIVYCHGNGGNKIDIVEIFQYLLYEFNIFSFDFSGAGNSEGDIVTLGYYENNDVDSVVSFLNKELKINKIILYGRSMGAVSVIRNSSNIRGMILDSPFSDFEKLCDDILSNKFFLPGIVRRMLIRSGREQIKEKAGFDILSFKPKEDAKRITVPTLIIHGKQDCFVSIEHSREIYKNISDKVYKKIIEVNGGHNDERGNDVSKVVKEFIINYGYEPTIVKEYKRRMKLNQSTINYVGRYNIKIDEIVKGIKRKRKFNNFNFKDRLRNNSRSKEKKSSTLITMKKRYKTFHKKNTKEQFESKFNYDNFITDEINMNKYQTEQINQVSCTLDNKTIIPNRIKIKNNAQLTKTQNEIDYILEVYKMNKGYNDTNKEQTQKNRIRSNRLNTLSSIFECDVRIKSSEISFNSIDKQSLQSKK